MERVDAWFAKSKYLEVSEPGSRYNLSFYDHDIDDKKDRAKLSRNAKNWQMILSKMIEPKTEEMTKQRNEILFAQLPLITST